MWHQQEEYPCCSQSFVIQPKDTRRRLQPLSFGSFQRKKQCVLNLNRKSRIVIGMWKSLSPNGEIGGNDGQKFLFCYKTQVQLYPFTIYLEDTIFSNTKEIIQPIIVFEDDYYFVVSTTHRFHQLLLCLSCATKFAAETVKRPLGMVRCCT